MINSNTEYLAEGVFDWLKKKFKDIKSHVSKSNIRPGDWFFYTYDSKMYEEGTLPFYDHKPLILCLGTDGKYVLGLNTHYIPIRQRKKLLNKLKSLYPNQWNDNKTLPNISWNTVKRDVQYAEYMIHLYIRERITEPVKISNKDMENVLNVDLSEFIGIDAEKVWRNYRKSKSLLDRTGKPD